MSRFVELSTLASGDLDEAWLWYEEQRDGLGDAFILAAEATMRPACTRPEAFLQVEGNVRRALVRRFPYAVIFTVQADRITVIAVLHTSRRPGEWRTRL